MGGRTVDGMMRAVWVAALSCLLLAPVVGTADAQQASETITDETREKLRDRLRLLNADAQAEAATETAEQARQGQAGGGASNLRPVPTQGSGVPRDAISEALLRIEGYGITEYLGTGLHYDVDSTRLWLTGPAEVVRSNQGIKADSMLVYHLNSTLLCGYGRPVLSGGGAAPVESQQVCYDIERRIGEAQQARTQYTDQTTWIVIGERVYPVGGNQVYSHNAMFTDCDLEEPHYHFAAQQVKMITDDVLLARNVTLNFGEVPVLWLPFMFQSLKQGRRSGLLTPRFGINDIARNQSNYNRRISNVGFYWAINDYLGAEMALDWFSGNWTALEGAFQYRWAEKFLEGGLTLRRFWRESGSRELTLATSSSWQIDERTSVRVDGNYTSSSDFVLRESRDPNELNRSIDSNAGISRRFDWGRLTLGASRRQFLTDDRVELTLPTLGLNLSPVTLFRATPAEASWYNNATWNAGLTARAHQSLQPDTIADRRTVDVGVNSSFTLGGLSWSQTANLNEVARLRKGVAAVDTTERRARWSTSINYQQRLIGTSTLTPGLSIRGEMVNSPRTGGVNVSAPLRVDFSAALRTDVFGFWPGVGPFSAMRHRLSPSVTYNFSPAAQADSLQREVFGRAEIREQNRITIGLSQTFEAKLRSDESEEEAAEPQLDPDAPPGEPMRLPQSRTITLLSLNTTAVAYDFVAAREDTLGGRWPGVVTGDISNSLTSDLLPGLQVGLTHDLFDERRDESGRQIGREFRPHLSSVNASFNLNADSWLVRLLGFGGGADDRAATPVAEADTTDVALDESRADLDLVGGRHRGIGAQRFAPAGPWNASLSYSMTRPRSTDESVFGENQMLRGQLSFQPTPGWSVRWSTGYSFTNGEFSDHILTLSREMHDWQANFDFLKAQNGNFTFQFRVHLKANPDLKLDYEQRGDPIIPANAPF